MIASINFDRLELIIRLLGLNSFKRLFCFFEGSGDVEYYSVRIGVMITEPREEFICDGKEKVLELHRLIVNNQKYQQAWVAFFIDKDFDDLQELPRDDRMYITPSYAIENFYVSPAAFGRMLRARFKKLTTVNSPDDLEGACEEVIELYKQRLEEFNDVVEELNAWMYLQRLEEKKQIRKKKVRFNDLELCFEVQLDKIEKKYTLDYLLTQTVSDSYPLDERDVIEQAQKFHNIDKTALFRGKCLIEFLYLFVTRLQNGPRPPFLLTVKHDLNLSQKKITADLSQYADTPDCLRNFLSVLAKKRPTSLSTTQ